MSISKTVLATFVCMAGLHAADDVVQLQSGFQFDLRPTLKKTFSYPVHIGSFIATPKRLHLLIQPNYYAPGKQAILDLDMGGTVIRVVPLEFYVDHRWLQLDRSGSLLVWRREQSSIRPDVTEAIYRVGNDGKVEEEATFKQRLRYPSELGGSMWGITPNGCIRKGATIETKVCSISTVDPNGIGFMYKQLSETELVAIEPSTPALIRLKPAQGELSSHRIMSPEIQTALGRAISSPQLAVIIGDMVVSPEKHLWVKVTRQPLATGAAILKLSENGDVLGRFRCALPKDAAFQTTGNPEGFMLPTLIGYTNATLFVLDQLGMLTTCQVPSGPARHL